MMNRPNVIHCENKISFWGIGLKSELDFEIIAHVMEVEIYIINSNIKNFFFFGKQ